MLKWPIFEEMISAIIKSSTCKKLLGVKVDYKVKFSEHLDGIFKKASHRVSAFLDFLFISCGCVIIELLIRK